MCWWHVTWSPQHAVTLHQTIVIRNCASIDPITSTVLTAAAVERMPHRYGGSLPIVVGYDRVANFSCSGPHLTHCHALRTVRCQCAAGAPNSVF